MARLLIYPDDQFPAGLKCQVLSFLRMYYWQGFIGENRLRDWITPSRFHPLHFLLIENELVISHAEVVWKYLDHAGETHKTYGLTSVFTYPSFQKQGYGHQLVMAATDTIVKSDADIAMFHCDPSLKGFYSRCGWIAMENTKTYIGSKDNPELADELLMMRFFSPKGLAGRSAFETQPVFFNEDCTW
jgi:predicted N-acetyltransferase YhbS